MHFTTRNTTLKTNSTKEYSLISMYCVIHQLFIAKLAAISKEWSTSPLYTYDGDKVHVWRHRLPPLMNMTTTTMTRCQADRMVVNMGIYDVVDKRCDTFDHYEANHPFATFAYFDAVDLSVKAYSNYRYGFQGQEKDDEIKGEGNSINFTYRMHDTRLGRFLSIDPHAQSYPDLNPYNFAANNPIIFVDPDGKDIVVFIQEGTEQYSGHTKIGVITKVTVNDKVVEMITIYEFMPGSAGNSAAPSTVDELVNGKSGYTITSTIFTSSRDFANKHDADYIRISTTEAQDKAATDLLNRNVQEIYGKNEKSIPTYFAASYNCSGFATQVLISVLFPDDPTLGAQSLLPLPIPFTQVISPNKLWNDLIKKDNVVEKSSSETKSESAVISFLMNEIVSTKTTDENLNRISKRQGISAKVKGAASESMEGSATVNSTNN